MRFAVLLLLVSLLSAGPMARPAPDCSLTSTGMTPLTDLAGTYRGVEGGLYPNGTSIRPASHEAVGLDLALNGVRPLARQGSSDPTGGRIVLISIGMSNTSTEFGRFIRLLKDDPSVNPRLTIVNGAVSGSTADRYRDPGSVSWKWALEQLARHDVTPEQVQVAWVNVVLPGFGPDRRSPTANFPEFPQMLQVDLETMSRQLKTLFPNIKIVYFSSRIRAYITPRGLSPEPAAYETAFAVRWAIANQIRGVPTLGLDVAPWMSWGPYLWADGMVPRSDGLTYACSDLEADFVHPAAEANRKVAEQLRAFLATDPTAVPWFLRRSEHPPAVKSLTASPPGGAPGVRVRFSASAADPDVVREYIWTFGDGTYAYGPSPDKAFHVRGEYPVHLTVVDRAGNAALETITVHVGSGRP